MIGWMSEIIVLHVLLHFFDVVRQIAACNFQIEFFNDIVNTHVYFRVKFSSYFQIAHTRFHSRQKTVNIREIFAELRHEIFS